MAAIEIRDLEISKELDRKAMAKISGGALKTPVVDGWALVSQSAPLRTNAGQLWVPSKDISGAFELKTKFLQETTIKLTHTEFVAG